MAVGGSDPRWPRVAVEVGRRHQVERDWLVEVAHSVSTELGHIEFGVTLERDHLGGGQDLSTVGGVDDACSLVHGKRPVVVVDGPGVTGVQTHPNLDRLLGRPVGAGQRSLTLHGRLERVGCVGERDEEGITFGQHLDTAVLHPHGAQELVMLVEEVVVALAEVAQDPGAPFDVSEQERDRSRRQPLGHRRAPHRAHGYPLE